MRKRSVFGSPVEGAWRRGKDKLAFYPFTVQNQICTKCGCSHSNNVRGKLTNMMFWRIKFPNMEDLRGVYLKTQEEITEEYFLFFFF